LERAAELRQEVERVADYHQWLLATPDLEVARWMREWRGEGPVPQVTMGSLL